ncbi:Homocysteine S-methyltransferase 1, partial [Rhizophlyctis rosea]
MERVVCVKTVPFDVAEKTDPLFAIQRLLKYDPEAIKAVHRSYLESSADIIISSSYQASLPGFVAEGFSEREAKELMRKSTILALEARSEFLESPAGKRRQSSGRPNPLVGISLGSYGAFRCDGSEGTGQYDDADNDAIYSYHLSRLEILDDAALRNPEHGPNLLIFETIPTLREARIISTLLTDHPNLFPNIPAWISSRGKEDGLTGHGEPISDCVDAVLRNARVVGVGVNCTHPKFVSALLIAAKEKMVEMGLWGGKVLFAYPNSGETWDE